MQLYSKSRVQWITVDLRPGQGLAGAAMGSSLLEAVNMNGRSKRIEEGSMQEIVVGQSLRLVKGGEVASRRNLSMWGIYLCGS